MNRAPINPARIVAKMFSIVYIISEMVDGAHNEKYRQHCYVNAVYSILNFLFKIYNAKKVPYMSALLQKSRAPYTINHTLLAACAIRASINKTHQRSTADFGKMSVY